MKKSFELKDKLNEEIEELGKNTNDAIGEMKDKVKDIVSEVEKTNFKFYK